MAKTRFKSVSEYIASKPKEAQTALKLVRDAIRKAVPEAEEAIAYQMAMYKLNGGPVLYFGAWKEHYSLYPVGAPVVDALKKELSGYEIKKNTLQLRYTQPV